MSIGRDIRALQQDNVFSVNIRAPHCNTTGTLENPSL